MASPEIAQLDGVWHVTGTDGVAAPIRLAGRPVEAFIPGWRPRGAALGFAPWLLLDLVHDSGLEATWILDAAREHRTSVLAALDEAERAAIADAVVAIADAVWRDVLCAPVPRRPAALDRLDGVNRTMRAELLDLALKRRPMPTRVLDRQDAAGLVLHRADGGGLALEGIATSLSGNLQDAFAEALSTGSIACASPVDAHPLAARDSLVLGEHRTAYRIVDPRHGLVFYVGATHALFAKSDLFIPEANIVVRQHADDATRLDDLAAIFLLHALQEADGLLDYLGSPARRLASACRGPDDLHTGHHLWNELTGLDRLLRRAPRDRLPVVIVPDTDEGSEVFAPLETIFPEFKGRIDRRLRWPQRLAGFVYAQGYCLIRVLDEHVSRGLSLRLREAAAREPPTLYDRALAARITAERTPCILLGVRVENRTAVDLEATLSGIIAHLARRLGRIVIILDGHNARTGHDPVSSFGSFGQLARHEHPVFTELRLAQALARRFRHSGVQIVNLFGGAMARSLFWSERSAFFVAFWGAGLAKYRWACNRPGLVLSNRWNLTHRGDLDIYHAPRYQEAGAAIRFIDADLVTDDATAPVLFAPVDPVPTYSNFHLEMTGLQVALDAMLAAHPSTSGAPSAR
ncbi:hypothetical protein [Lichenicoccus sp.]|uniref:hypothetical protein n=1 Tax=Lichenicoccus sp. TaxID=2781899 RepID=UPI003D110D2E